MGHPLVKNAAFRIACLLLGSLMSSLPLIGQDCSCKEYLTQRFEINEKLVSGDSIAFRRLITPLSSKNPYCRLLYDDLNLEFKIKMHQFEGIENALATFEERNKKPLCPNDAVRLIRLKLEYYQESDQLELATKTAFEYLKLAENEDDHYSMLHAISVIISIYSRQDQDQETFSYVRKAGNLVLKIDDVKEKAKAYNWLSRNYETIYAMTDDKSKLDTALLYANAAYDIAKKYQLSRQLQLVFHNKEAIAYHQGNLKQSLSYHDSIRRYIDLNSDVQKLPIFFQMKSETLLELGRTKEALMLQDSAIFYARKYSQPSYLVNYLKSGADKYASIGNFEKSLLLTNEYINIKDSVQTAKRSQIINELEAKYKNEINTHKISQLNHQRTLLYGTIALLLLLGGLLFLLYRQRIMKKDQLILETAQRLNRARMNPHFFFNALASLQSFAINETDSMALAENLSKFSHIMRETLENTYREFNTIYQEINFLTEYLELQQMRFPDKFTFSIKNETEDADSLFIPSMILQPFVENSVEHGFSNIDYIGHLEIIFKTQNETTQIQISDNGRGFNDQAPIAKPYVSRASQIIKDRIYLLNLKLKSDAQFKIHGSGDGQKGVAVHISLPLIHEN